MNNLVHIPTTPAAQRGRERKGWRGREMGRWRKTEMDRAGEDKSKGENEGWVKGKKGEKEGKKKRVERQMIADVCQGIT